MKKEITAAILIIGNEILSGKVQDKNVNFIANRLANNGIFLKEVRIVLDVMEDVVEAVNLLRSKYTYLFTTGGIGPTHDDITASSIAKAFGVELVVNEEVLEDIEAYFHQKGEELNDARKKMAYFPENGELIKNNITKSPGFKIENVFVMAGIPVIMNDMFNDVEKFLEKSEKIISKSLKIIVGESLIAKDLSDLQEKYPQVSMGSYPFTIEIDNDTIKSTVEFVIKNNIKHATDIVFRGNDQIIVDKAYEEFKNIVISHNYECY